MANLPEDSWRHGWLFQAMFDADSAVIDLQGTGATDAEKTRAAVKAAAPSIRREERRRLRGALDQKALAELHRFPPTSDYGKGFGAGVRFVTYLLAHFDTVERPREMQ